MSPQRVVHSASSISIVITHNADESFAITIAAANGVRRHVHIIRRDVIALDVTKYYQLVGFESSCVLDIYKTCRVTFVVHLNTTE